MTTLHLLLIAPSVYFATTTQNPMVRALNWLAVLANVVAVSFYI